MNRHNHSLIFNRSRGCLMAVAETAKSSGKASGESRPIRTSKSKATPCRKAHPNWAVGSIGWQVNRSVGYGLHCIQGSFNSALSRSQYERFAPSQIGTDPVAPLLAFGNTSLAIGVSPYLFVATQSPNTPLMGAAKAATAKNASVSATISFGTSTSSSETNTANNSSAGSSIQAANNVNIQATGAGLNSTLTIQGSNVNANSNVSLASTGDVNLLAAANTANQTSNSKSSSSSVGVTFSLCKVHSPQSQAR